MSFYGESSDQPQKQRGESATGCAGERGRQRGSSCTAYKPSADVSSVTAPISC